MSNHKVGDLLIRVEYHSKWNKRSEDICYGTIIDIVHDKYKVYWMDDFWMPNNPYEYHVYQIDRFKHALMEWLKKD